MKFSLSRFKGCALLLLPLSQLPAASLAKIDQVDLQGHVFRGPEPKSKVQQLKDLQFTNVVIVKTENKNEVTAERQALQQLGIESDQYPLLWHTTNLTPLCHEVVAAVRAVQRLQRQGKKVYFHCTLGEDRTGIVAGLFRMVDQGWTPDRAFRDEMCKHGYSDGDPHKPAQIVQYIQQSLTPVFLALSKSANPTLGLDDQLCQSVQVPASVPTCK